MSLKKMKDICMVLSICMNIGMPACLAADLSIDEAVDMALAKNNDVKIANEEKMAAQANYEATKGANGVSISLGSSLSARDSADTTFERGNSNSISATLPLYTGNKNELNIDSKKLELLKSELNLERTEETIKYNTIKAYFDILEAKQNVNIEQESVNDYEINLSTFRNIIKIDRNEPINLTDDFVYQIVRMSLPECLDYAMAYRKDRIASQIDVEIAKNNIDVAKAGYLPTVNLSVSTSWDKQALPSGNDHDYQAGVSANWNIFDNNVTKSNVKSAEASYNKAEYELSDTEDTIDLEVRQAYLNMREAERRFNSTAMAVKQAEEDYFIATEKYKVGAGIILDVIDAELALSQARLNYASAQYDYARYKANLEYVIGTPKGETIDG